MQPMTQRQKFKKESKLYQNFAKRFFSPCDSRLLLVGESTLTDSWEVKIENLATISNCFKDLKVSTTFQKQLTVILRIL